MTMSREQLLDSLTSAGAVLSGHFVLTSGRHSATYVQCARILEDPALTTALAADIAEQFRGCGIDLVAAPAVGGLIIGFAVAQALGVKFIFTEREQGVMRFRRAFEVPVDARVLIVEDVVTTGGSVSEVADLVHAAGGVVAAVASIIDRGGEKLFTSEYTPLLTLEVESWEADSCGLCAAGVEITSPGSRRIGG